jgi:tRNA1Val (adenine37-N6)-methyltransferase
MSTPQPGWLLGGKVRHDQREDGHRTGIEPVLLAASVPARPGQHVLEGGSGAGAGLLCLAQRVPGIEGLGIEIDEAQCTLARRNAAANGFAALRFDHADITETQPGKLPGGKLFHHAFANPPWHAPGTASPDDGRERAKRASPGLLGLWAASLAAALRPRGTLTFVVAAAVMAECLAGFTAARCGSLAVMPLWPRHGQPARLVLLRGVRDGKGSTRLLPGLVLHSADGGYTQEAGAILRDAAALEL